ncbi:MAG: aspartate--ammonia ligase [Clostridiales bacterium]|nr:aspartate--ammonia ligase [Clostridiales bacterium]
MAQETYQLQIPEGYHPKMSLFETEQAIKELKDFFQRELAKELSLTRVSAPLFVLPETGLNDNLNGVERPVSFDIRQMGGRRAEVVHSLAKWKRYALRRYGIPEECGLYTDMNAVRRDETPDNLHSFYVDQWDWERVITREERCEAYLKETVRRIYRVFLRAQEHITARYPQLDRYLPEEIHFITTQELEDQYPSLTPAERETRAAKEYGAFFLMQIGGRLRSGQRHDGRAPDYDDWSLNGDIFFYYPVLDRAFEISSMGIRVDEVSLAAQLLEAGCPERGELPFQKALLAGELPLTIGGGIGQSRLCLFFLNKAHIGEVQASIWPDRMAEECAQADIPLL